MSSLVRSWMALGVLAFVANAAVRPAIARAANDAPPAPPPPGAYAPAPPAQSAPPPAGYAPPAPAPYPAPPYGTYPPPGYAPAPQYPGYAAYPGYPQPQLTKVHRPRRGLVTGGAITFGVSWGIAASISLLVNDNCTGSCSNTADYLWIPIAGPFVVAARDNSSDGNGIFILWGAAQAAGATMLIIGLIGHDVMEYRYAKSGATLQLSPLLARNASGMALTARW